MKTWASTLGICLTACGVASGATPSGIGSTSGSDTVVQTYGRTFHFASPVDCSIFVAQRIVDTTNDDAEYDARPSPQGATIAATYSILPEDPYPVRVNLSDGAGEPLLTVAMNAHDLEVLDETQHVALTVRGYDGNSPATTPGGWSSPPADEGVLADAMRVLQCMLPAQTALGAVPSFFENRGERTGAGGVVGVSSDAPPLLPSWDGARTILGAYFTAAVCIRPTESGVAWACSCPPIRANALIGELRGLCPGFAPPRDSWGGRGTPGAATEIGSE
jgi:hypothetical protein